MAWDVDTWQDDRDRERAEEVARKKGRLSMREIIVLTIVAVLLVAVCMPLFTKRSKQNLSMISAQNLMQWGIALNLYLIENQNTLPDVGPHLADTTLETAWYNALPPYLSQDPLSKLGTMVPDPERPSLWVDPAVDPRRVPRFENFAFTYAMNRYLQPDLAHRSYRIFDVQNPSAVVFLTEVVGVDPGALPETVDYRHGKDEPKAHVLFCDGHVELIAQSRLSERLENIVPQGTTLADVSWAPFVGAPGPLAKF